MSTYTISTSSRGFLIGSLVASAAGVGLTITNAVYYSKARNNCNSITNTSANVLMWLNIILAVIFGIIFIWTIYHLVVHPDLRKEISNKPTDYISAKKAQLQNYLSSEPEGFITPQNVGMVPSPKQTTVSTTVTHPTISTHATSTSLASNVI
jgi:hypothetical protein